MSAFESSMVDSKVQKALYSKMVAVNRQTPSSKPIDNIPHGTFSDLKSSLDSAQTFLPRDIIGATPNDTNPFEQQILRSVYCKVSADVVDKKTKKIMNFASYMTGGPGGGEETTQANRPISFKDTITPNSNSYRGDTGITSVSVTQKSYFLNEITINYTCPDPMDFESRIQPIFLKHGRLIVVEFGFGVNEAVYLGCAPVLPNRLVYPEFYSEEFLYNTFDESVEMVERILDDYDSWMPSTESCQMGVLGNGNNFIMEKWFNE